MEQLSEMLAGADLVVYIVLGVFILALLALGARMVLGKGKGRADKNLPVAENVEDNSEAVSAEQGEAKPEDDSIKLGRGAYKCLCFRKIKGVIVADFTSINKPVGELYQFDPSCPFSGSGYIVRQLEDKTIMDYDPREVKVKTDETPDYAWHAINWKEDVNAFWTVPAKWWKNTASWFAAGVLVIVFISALASFG